jgi:hypothetical protein
MLDLDGLKPPHDDNCMPFSIDVTTFPYGVLHSGEKSNSTFQDLNSGLRCLLTIKSLKTGNIFLLPSSEHIKIRDSSD